MESAREQVFLARQPIFDRQRRVFGYELLFCPPQGTGSKTHEVREETAAAFSEAILSFGLDTLTHGRPTFVKVSREVLLAGLPAALPANQVVVELPEDIDASEEVRDACADLRRKGYRIALDQFTPSERTTPLLKYVDYLKADVAGLEAIAKSGGRPVKQPVLVATHVESAEDFAAAARLGCATFQGGFIGRPVLKASKEIPANRLVYMRLFHALQKPDISPKEVEELIKPDASLVFKVLRAVNSASFAQHSRVDSLRQALVLLGCGTVRQWSSLWAMASFSKGAPDELVAMSTLRGRTCELVASADVSGAFGDGFLVGMCSLLDAILEVPMSTVLAHLPLPEEADAALRGTTNDCRRLLDAVVAYESGDWDRCMTLSAEAGIDQQAIPTAYAKSLQWYAAFQKASTIAAAA